MTRPDFSVYSWDSWFRSLTSVELDKLRDQWMRVILKLPFGHELDVMVWDCEQAMNEIRRRRDEVRGADRQAG